MVSNKRMVRGDASLVAHRLSPHWDYRPTTMYDFCELGPTR